MAWKDTRGISRIVASLLKAQEQLALPWQDYAHVLAIMGRQKHVARRTMTAESTEFGMLSLPHSHHQSTKRSVHSQCMLDKHIPLDQRLGESRWVPRARGPRDAGSLSEISGGRRLDEDV